MASVKTPAPWRRITWGVLLLLALALSLPSAALAEELSPLSLEQAIERARKHHPQIAQARGELDVERAAALRARSGRLPGFLTRIAYEPQTANVVPSPTYSRALVHRVPQGAATVLDTNGEPVTAQCIPPLRSNGEPDYSVCRRVPGTAATSYGLTSFWTASFGVVWTAFDWGQTHYGVRAAKMGVHARELAIRAAEVDATLAVKLAYYAALAGEAAVAVAEEAVATQTKHLDQARSLAERGLKTRADVALAESDVANAELTLAQAQGGLASAFSDLRAAMGERDRRSYRLVTAMPSDDTAISPAMDLERAIAKHPETESLSLLARSYSTQARAQRGQYLPRLVLTLGPSFTGPALDQMVTNFGGSVALVYPAGTPLTGMNPWAVKADVDQAAALARLTEARKAEVENGLRQLAERTESEITAAVTALRAARRRVETTEERRDLMQGQYGAGVASMLELSDAELAYIDARFREISARLQLCQARATLDRLYARSR